MIGKIVIGKSFGGCVRYVMEKKDAELIFAEGIRAENVSLIVKDFNSQRCANPNLSKAVGHISLNWSDKDTNQLDNEVMLKTALNYLEMMAIRNTQVLIARHYDGSHPHLHIVYNRVDNDGRTITDSFQLKKNIEACKRITLERGFYIAKDRSAVNRKSLRGKDKMRYMLNDKVNTIKIASANWEVFRSKLTVQGIEMVPKYRGDSNVIQGVSFKYGEYSFKGSELSRSLSYGNLEDYFSTKLLPAFDSVHELVSEEGVGFTSAMEKRSDMLPELLESLFEPVYFHGQNEEEPRKKKKKKQRDKGLSR